MDWRSYIELYILPYIFCWKVGIHLDVLYFQFTFKLFQNPCWVAEHLEYFVMFSWATISAEHDKISTHWNTAEIALFHCKDFYHDSYPGFWKTSEVSIAYPGKNGLQHLNSHEKWPSRGMGLLRLPRILKFLIRAREELLQKGPGPGSVDFISEKEINQDSESLTQNDQVYGIIAGWS